MNNKSKDAEGVAPFGATYAKYYDVLYSDKDYDAECDFVERIFTEYCPHRPRTVLDCGSGTGGHALRLGERGFKVTGIDSSRHMVELARHKLRLGVGSTEFMVANLTDFNLHRTFEACTSMFSVINYLTTRKDLSKVFHNIRRHLVVGSPLVFDFWYGPAVLAIGPGPRTKSVVDHGMKVVRFAQPELDIRRSVCKVKFTLAASKGNKIIFSEDETHLVRYYFKDEIQRLLESAGFKLLKMCRFMDLDSAADDRSWDATAIAMAT